MNSGDQVGDMDRGGQDTEPPDGNKEQCETSSRTVVGDGGDGGSDVERKASTGSDNDYNTEVITVRKSRSGSMSRYISFSIDDENKVIYSICRDFNLLSHPRILSDQTIPVRRVRPSQGGAKQ